MIIAEDYAFPYSQVQGFMVELLQGSAARSPTRPGCRSAARTTPSVIAKIPEDVDALLVVLGGADAVNFLTQYEQAGGDKPMIGGSITVDQTVLNYKGKRRDSLIGTPSAGPIADNWDDRRLEDLRRRLQDEPIQGRLPQPVAVRPRLLRQQKATLDGARRGQRRPLRRPEEVPRGAAEAGAEDAHRRRHARRQPQGHRHHLRHRGGGRRRRQSLQQGGARWIRRSTRRLGIDEGGVPDAPGPASAAITRNCP